MMRLGKAGILVGASLCRTTRAMQLLLEQMGPYLISKICVCVDCSGYCNLTLAARLMYLGGLVHDAFVPVD